MKKTNMQWGVIATATVAIVGALASPQALAKTKAKAPANEGYAAAPSANSRVDALEAQLQAMQAELSSLRAAQNRPSTESAKVQELDEWSQSVKAKQAKHEKSGHDDNLIFFRGGYARNDAKRNDILTGGQIAGDAMGVGSTNQDGYYVGAGFDFGLTDNVWGLVDNTSVLAELMFDYRNFGEQNTNSALGGAPLPTLVNNVAAGAQGTSNINRVTVTQFTLAASPKIKFMKGSAFRPWIIPFGLTVNVISPPSNGVTVLNPGVQFGTGAEYAIWKAIKVGADVRYNLTGRSVDGVNTDGLTAGGYLGIGF